MPVNLRSAHEINQDLQAAIAAWEKAEHNAVVLFSDVMRRKLFLELGYSSIYQYARVELGFSDTRTGDFVRLVRKLAKLPVLREAVESGKVGYTKAREIITVASPKNDAKWVERAQSQTRSVLISQVRKVRAKAAQQRKANPAQVELLPVSGELAAASADRAPVSTDQLPASAAVLPASADLLPVSSNLLPASAAQLAREVPVRVSLEMTVEQYARYEELLVRLGAVDKVETVLESLAGFLDGLTDSNEASCRESTPRGVVAPVQIVVHHCPRCDEAVVPTNRGELKLSPAEFDRLKQDARIYVEGGRNDTVIPPKLRLQALARDRHACAAPGCQHRHFLHVHHIKPRAYGGGNELGNLITLCSGCHRQQHRADGLTRKPSAPRK